MVGKNVHINRSQILALLEFKWEQTDRYFHRRNKIYRHGINYLTLEHTNIRNMVYKRLTVDVFSWSDILSTLFVISESPLAAGWLTGTILLKENQKKEVK